MAFEPRYTPEQKQAVLDLMLNHQLGPTEAARQAGHGINNLPPFHVPKPTAYHWRRQARQAQERALERDDTDPRQALEHELRITLRALRKALRHETKKPDLDLDRMRWLLRCQKEAVSLARQLPMLGQKPPQIGPGPVQPLADLLAKYRDTADEQGDTRSTSLAS